MTDILLHSNQTINASIALPAGPYDALPVWHVNNGLKIVVAADHLSADVTAKPPLKDGNITHVSVELVKGGVSYRGRSPIVKITAGTGTPTNITLPITAEAV